MRKIILLTALLATAPLAAAGFAAAQDALSVGTVLGTTMDEVTASLTGQGYEVRKSEMEDGKIEVYFVKGQSMGEVYVDAATGKITKLSMK